jgi:hypothetical protein
MAMQRLQSPSPVVEYLEGALLDGCRAVVRLDRRGMLAETEASAPQVMKGLENVPRSASAFSNASTALSMRPLPWKKTPR